MTIRGLFRFMFAYTAATLTVVPVAIAGAEVGRWFDYHLTWYHVAVPVWLAAVGVPSVGWGSRHLSKTLGVRPDPVLQIAGRRDIPIVGGALGDVTRRVLGAPGRGDGASLPVAESVSIRCGDYVFEEDVLTRVLRKAWTRQRSGRHPLARGYWLDKRPFHGDRDKYDAFALALEACGVLVGRRPGASGRLVTPPLTAIHELRHKPYEF